MPTPGDIICGDVRLESLAPASLGAEVFQPVFVAQRGDWGETLWLTVIEGQFTPTQMNMSTFMAGANAMLGMRHPTLARVVLVDREADYAVVGYEALPGAESMTDVITRGGSRRLLGKTALETARGLAFLHRRAMMHGALTPSTVVLWEGTPMMWEHGIAALCAPKVFGPRARSLGGDVVAPEIPSGTPMSASSDVFAWGATMAAVAAGMLGSEAVACVLERDVNEERQGWLFELIREALSPEPRGRPRDGTHLLERLLELQDADARAPGKTARGDDAALSDLARRYLQEMSTFEGRKKPEPGTPVAAPDSDSSGLGRLRLKKAKVSTESGKIVGFVDDSNVLFDESPTPAPSPAPATRPSAGTPAALPKPRPLAKPVAPVLPKPPNVGPSSAGDSSTSGVPLWKSVADSRPRAADTPARRSEPGAWSSEAQQRDPIEDGGLPEMSELGALGSIEEVVLHRAGEPELDPIAAADSLREAFADLSAAADGQTRARSAAASNPSLAAVRDDPSGLGGGELFEPQYGDEDAALELDHRGGATPIPARPSADAESTESGRRRKGGWIRDGGAKSGDPGPVAANLRPAQDYGDGVRKRRFEPAAPERVVEDQTPRDPTPIVDLPAQREESGLSKLRKLWPRSPKAAAAAARPDADEQSGQHEEIARSVLDDLQRTPDEDRAQRRKKKKRKSGETKVAAATAPADASARQALAPDAGPLPPVIDEETSQRQARARPVAAFVPPRSPGPHGPPAALWAGIVAAAVGVIPLGATIRAVAAHGGLDRLGREVIRDSGGEPADPDTAPVNGGERAQCPTGTVPLPRRTATGLGEAIVCLDAAEYPGAGEIPLTGIDFEAAQEKCEARGQRLCAEDEWVLACAGVSGRRYPYGEKREKERCNAEQSDVAAGGSFGGCVTPEGALDLVGNVAEWVAEGVALGGSAGNRSATCITKLRPGKKSKRPSIGTRCCVDVVP